MPQVSPGALTKDGVPLLELYTKITEDIGYHKEDLADLRDRFAYVTTDTVVDIAVASMEMRPLGDSARPFRQHVDTFELALAAPQRFGVGAAIEAAAWESGISARRIMQQAEGALKADRRHVIRVIIDRIFQRYGWYDGWMTPPQFQSNIFVAQHTHYLAYAASATPTVTAASAAKRHITEHGHDGNQIVGWVNGAQVAKLEQSAEFADSSIMDSPLIQDLQKVGFQPAFQLAGIPHMQNDWVPEGYAAYLCFETQPMGWRIDAQEQRDLIVYDRETVPNAGTYWFGEYVRYSPKGGPTVTAPGAGVAVKLDAVGEAPTYTAPTAFVPTSV